MWTDTPLPQEEPAGQNPPDGVMIDYYLNANAGSVILEILDTKGNLIRKYTDADTMYQVPDVNIPHYWIRFQETLSPDKGSHRFLWDMRYEPLNIPVSYPIRAIYNNTAPRETSPFVMPGNYVAKLTVDGKTWQQSFTIKMDPRVETPVADLRLQHDLSLLVYNDRLHGLNALKEITDLRRKIKERLPDAMGSVITELNACDTLAARFETTSATTQKENFKGLEGMLGSVFNILQESDMSPTSQAIAAAKETDQAFKTVWQKWMEAKRKIKNCLGENKG
jgi:hypothetical protein